MCLFGESYKKSGIYWETRVSMELPLLWEQSIIVSNLSLIWSLCAMAAVIASAVLKSR